MTPEGKIVKKILDYLNSQDCCVAWKIHGGPHQRKGILDIMCCWYGLFLAFEVKVPSRRHKLTELQAHCIKQIRKAHGEAHLVTSLNEVKQVLQSLEDEGYQEAVR